MRLADVAQTTSLRWTFGVALALVLQSTLIAGLIYWSTVNYATAKIDETLAAECKTLAALPYGEMLEEVGEKVERDVHRVDLIGLFDPQGRAIAGNIASMPAALVAAPGPIVVGLVRTSPLDPVPNPSRSVTCATS